MRVAVLTYPMLFQRLGGLQVQIRETVSALQALGIDAHLFDSTRESLSDFDLVHVFAAINGNWRIVEAAKNVGKPVVMSSILHESDKWRSRERAKLASWLTARITGWEYATGYDQARTALELADRIITNGKRETDFVVQHFDQSAAKIRDIPNGIASRFLNAEPKLFIDRTGLAPGFILCAATVSPYKNQLGVIRAAKGFPVPIVLIGPCAKEHQDYLAQCLAEADGQAQYLGALQNDDPLLASAYAAAGVTVLPSRTEVMPFTILESLGAGTPAIVTKYQSLGLEPRPPLFIEVDPANTAEIRSAIRTALSGDSRPELCREIVSHLDWSRIAQQIAAVYRDLAGDRCSFVRSASETEP